MKKIHIGFHKAGSTFLQQIVFPHAPNYMGRFYEGKKDAHTNLCKGKCVKKGCEEILKHYSRFDNHFISNEIFTSLKHKNLVELLEKYKYDKVLIVERSLKDLMKSRRRHPAHDFFLQQKINSKVMDKEVIKHYSIKELSKKINNLTIVNFEKFFGGNKREIKKLSQFLECEVEDIVLTHLHKKINSSKTK